MAAVAGANAQAFGFTTVNGKHLMTSSNVPVLGCYVSCEYTGTYASGDNATLAAGTAIQNARRNGKTVTLRSACWAAPALETVSGSDNKLGAKTVAVSGGTLTSELTQTDISTERADGAMGTFKEPIVYYCTFTEA
jgi:hypothetical protein